MSKFKFRTFAKNLGKSIGISKTSASKYIIPVYSAREGGFVENGKLKYPLLAYNKNGEAPPLAFELVSLAKYPERLQLVHSYITNNYIEKDLLRGISDSNTMLVDKNVLTSAFHTIQCKYIDPSEWSSVEEQEEAGGFPASYYVLKETLNNDA